MQRKKHELTGQVFGKLTVLRKKRGKNKTPHNYWHCRCECGREYIARGSLLFDGQTWRCKACASAASVETRRKGPVKETIEETTEANGKDDFALRVYCRAAEGLNVNSGDEVYIREIMEMAHRKLLETD